MVAKLQMYSSEPNNSHSIVLTRIQLRKIEIALGWQTIKLRSPDLLMFVIGNARLATMSIEAIYFLLLKLTLKSLPRLLAAQIATPG